MLLHVWATTKKDFQNGRYAKYVENCETMTSLSHSFAYSYRLFKKYFVENNENYKFHIFLICYPIYIKFPLFCSKLYSFYWINLNLDWISPLNQPFSAHFMSSNYSNYVMSDIMNSGIVINEEQGVNSNGNLCRIIHLLFKFRIKQSRVYC